MFEKLTKPTHSDPAKQELINHVYATVVGGTAICLTIQIAVLVIFPLGYIGFQQFAVAFFVPLLMQIGLAFTFWKMRRLELEQMAGIVVAVGVGVDVIAMLASPDGFFDPAILATTFILIIISYYMSERWLRISSAIFACNFVLLFILENSGLKTTDHPEPTIFHLILVISFISASRWFLIHGMQNLRVKTEELRVSRDKLSNYQVELEEQVEERTAELIIEKNRAEEANLAKSSFLAKMSHELRTPLNAIIGYSELIEETADCPEEDEQKDIAQDAVRIQAAAQNLLTLINSLLDLSKIEASSMELLLEDIDVRQIIDETMIIISPLLNHSGNSFHLNLPNEALTVKGDLQKLKQIMVNILNNAIKFTDKGSITLAVAKVFKFGRDFVEFQIRDTGIGMQVEFMNRMFDPFSQADQAFSRKYQGTGLGLTLTKQFVEMMNGEISVQSVSGKGTTFFIYIPASVVLAETTELRETV